MRILVAALAKVAVAQRIIRRALTVVAIQIGSRRHDHQSNDGHANSQEEQAFEMAQKTGTKQVAAGKLLIAGRVALGRPYSGRL